MGVTLVSGVPGVGASAVCEAARRRLEDGYELINFGDVMLEQAALRGLATGREDLPALSVRETRRLQRRAGEYVADRAEVREVILTTYLAVETQNGYLPGLSASVLDDITPYQFILIEADPEAIIARREDAAREYGGEFGVREVGFQQDLNRAAAVSYAMGTGAPIRLIENSGAVEEAAEELVGMLRATAGRERGTPTQ